eukprot:1137796-Pelagomonas_calceolata.AAC.10
MPEWGIPGRSPYILGIKHASCPSIQKRSLYMEPLLKEGLSPLGGRSGCHLIFILLPGNCTSHVKGKAILSLCGMIHWALIDAGEHADPYSTSRHAIFGGRAH